MAHPSNLPAPAVNADGTPKDLSLEVHFNVDEFPPRRVHITLSIDQNGKASHPFENGTIARNDKTPLDTIKVFMDNIVKKPKGTVNKHCS